MTFSAPIQADAPPLIDPYGRHVSYLRVSVTDRCDFRCFYCMAENMTFLPRKDLLTLDRKSTRLNSSHTDISLMPSSA